MAGTRKTDKSSRGALAEGAERFDRVARAVKDSQLGRTKMGQGPAVSEAFDLSPEDAWARKYMTHCIGPVCYTVEAVTEPPVFAKIRVPPQASVPSAGSPAVGANRAQNSPAPARDAASPGPIGLVIGKPVRTGFRLGRLFGR